MSGVFNHGAQNRVKLPKKLAAETTLSVVSDMGFELSVVITNKGRLTDAGPYALHEFVTRNLVDMASGIHDMTLPQASVSKGQDGNADNEEAQRIVATRILLAWRNNPKLRLGQLMVLLAGDGRSMLNVTDQRFYDRAEELWSDEDKKAL